LARAPPVGYINWILGGMGIGFELWYLKYFIEYTLPQGWKCICTQGQ
jgi:hypothetical protein